jgi:hypothetical protein
MGEGPPPPGRMAWDYYSLLIERPCSAGHVEAKLSEVGASGWEFVQMLPWAQNQGKSWMLALFKRPRFPASGE